MKTATTTKRLQKLGFVPAIRYSEIEIGDRLIYNHGMRYTVTGLRFWGAWVYVTVKADTNGEQWTNRHLLKSSVGYIGSIN